MFKFVINCFSIVLCFGIFFENKAIAADSNVNMDKLFKECIGFEEWFKKKKHENVIEPKNKFYENLATKIINLSYKTNKIEKDFLYC